MSAVDTNVLVRFYVEDDPEQSRLVKELFNQTSSVSPLYVNQVVLMEWVWVLRNYYKISKETIIKELEIMLESIDLEIEGADVVKKAISVYKNSKADFADCLIAQKNVMAAKSPTYTFDKKASRLKGMKLLE